MRLVSYTHVLIQRSVSRDGLKKSEQEKKRGGGGQKNGALSFPPLPPLSRFSLCSSFHATLYYLNASNRLLNGRIHLQSCRGSRAPAANKGVGRKCKHSGEGGGGVRRTPINFGWMCAAKGLKMLTPVRMRETQKICVLRSKPEKWHSIEGKNKRYNFNENLSN